MNIKIKDPGSFLTHYIAMLLSMILAVPLAFRVAQHPSPERVLVFGIYSVSVIFLYAASSTYHCFDISPKWNKILQKIDHMMIFFMIAGSYTPICAVAMGDRTGWQLLLAVWGISLAGMAMNILWINCPKWVSSVIYIALGWICMFAFFKIRAVMTPAEFGCLVAGGVIYTVGGIIYALKLPVFKKLPRNFGNHEIFNCFDIAGSMFHYFMMYLLA